MRTIKKYAFEIIGITYLFSTMILPIILDKYNIIDVRLSYIIIMTGMTSFGFVCAYLSDKFPREDF